MTTTFGTYTAPCGIIIVPPLLIAVLPQEVRVYNCFAPPQRDSGGLMAENSAPCLSKRQFSGLRMFSSLDESCPNTDEGK